MPGYAEFRRWMASGEARLEGAVEGLDDAAAAAPSALPGWTRGHLLAHLARNADALNNLVTWARTGVRTPMYASAEARDADIEAGARTGAQALIDDVAGSAAAFASALDALTPTQRDYPVVTRGGVSRPVHQVAWMRAREAWLHLIDLDLGASMADLPGDFCAALCEELMQTFDAREDTPPFWVQLTDTGALAHVGPGDSGPTVVSTTRGIAGWLSGRAGAPGTREDEPAPVVGDWL